MFAAPEALGIGLRLQVATTRTRVLRMMRALEAPMKVAMPEEMTEAEQKAVRRATVEEISTEMEGVEGDAAMMQAEAEMVAP